MSPMGASRPEPWSDGAQAASASNMPTITAGRILSSTAAREPDRIGLDQRGGKVVSQRQPCRTLHRTISFPVKTL